MLDLDLPELGVVSPARPCSQKWSSMEGDPHVAGHNVRHLLAMTESCNFGPHRPDPASASPRSPRRIDHFENNPY